MSTIIKPIKLVYINQIHISIIEMNLLQSINKLEKY